MSRPRPLVLCILDGFGERAETDGNAIRLANAPRLRALAEGTHTLIGTSGPDVGLPVGQMGNSEVGHLNFGAGRIAMMDITRIDVDVAEGRIGDNAVFADVMRRAKEAGTRLHLFGLLSDGGVHSSIEHLFALLDAAQARAIPVVVHAFLDGRDTPPTSAGKYIDALEAHLESGKKGVIGTVAGRYWPMDRDKRWDRVHRGWSAIVRGRGARAATAREALAASYAADVHDEFVAPTCIGDYAGLEGALTEGGEWIGREVGFSFNFRPDRMRELSAMFTRRRLAPEADALVVEDGHPVRAFADGAYATMTEYDASLALPVAYPKDVVKDSFGEIIARAGLRQLRCAETEKYAHVTYFFSGGREEPFTGEDRKLIPSPRDVATYDQKPEMSAAAVSRAVVEAVEGKTYDFILVNFANPDMVGHTGKLDATIHAIEAVDAGVGAIVDAVRAAGGALLVTADHGNCEQMKDEHGNPHTAHTTNPVPLYFAGEGADGEPRAALDRGRICDVAPTMLELLGLEKPAAMTGVSLLRR